MSVCTKVKEALEARVDPTAHQEVALRLHARDCPDCGAEAHRWQRYGETIAQVRQALGSMEDLSPASWAQIRQGIMGRRSSLVTRLLWPALATAAVALVAWYMARLPVESLPPPAGAGPSTMAALPSVQEADPMPQSVRAGTVLVAGAATEEVRAFGRHTIALAPYSRATVVSWSPDSLILHVKAGRVRCEVQRASEDEIFEVRTRSAQVRVTGTVFGVGVRPNGITSIDVEHGQVSVTHGKDQVTVLGPGASMQVDRHGEAVAGSVKAAVERARRPAPPGGSVRDRIRDAATRGQLAPTRDGAKGSRSRELEIIEIEVPPQKAPGMP